MFTFSAVGHHRYQLTLLDERGIAVSNVAKVTAQ